MAFVMTFKNKGLACPVVICDICGKEITDGHMGAFTYDTEDHTTGKHCTDGHTTDMLFVHKGKCHDEADRRHVAKWGSDGGAVRGALSWLELIDLFKYAPRNLGFTDEEVIERIKSKDF